jgi:hypothetical protein
MWNITPEDVGRVKEELKGRQAAIQARYEDEIRKLSTELDDIDAFERVATAFAERHKRDEAVASAEPEMIAPLETSPVAADGTVEAEDLAHVDHPLLEARDEDDVDILASADVSSAAAEAVAAEAVVAEASVARKASARWRVRI